MSRLTPEEAEERECMAEDRAKGKKEDALIESGIVERFLRGGCKSATFPGGQLLTRDEHKAICAHILYLQQQTDVDKDFITQYQRQVKDLTEQLSAITGWREYDWPEGFDRRTADLMVENMKRVVKQDSEVTG